VAPAPRCRPRLVPWGACDVARTAAVFP
jgi:hypothetical protein